MCAQDPRHDVLSAAEGEGGGSEAVQAAPQRLAGQDCEQGCRKTMETLQRPQTLRLTEHETQLVFAYKIRAQSQPAVALIPLLKVCPDRVGPQPHSTGIHFGLCMR